MKKYNLAILANESSDDHLGWVNACHDHSGQVEFCVIDLSKSDWFEKLVNKRFHYLLAKPPGHTQLFKDIYDERIQIISEVLQLPIYPSPKEIYLHENKRYLYSWLKAYSIPHPKTYVFYHIDEALSFCGTTEYPIVAKTNIGASGSGVEVLNNKNDAQSYVHRAFSEKGTNRRWGPNLDKGRLIQRGFNYLRNPGEIRKKIVSYNAIRNDRQRGFVIFQEFVPHSFEWRVVSIGDSYFAHKKLLRGEKASGSLLKNYDNPPLELFDFVKDIVDKHHLLSQAVDLFEKPGNGFLVNEMQCVFGQSDEYQMLVNGVRGRYRNRSNEWIFEPGDFNQNQSYTLRLQNVIQILDAGSSPVID